MKAGCKAAGPGKIEKKDAHPLFVRCWVNVRNMGYLAPRTPISQAHKPRLEGSLEVFWDPKELRIVYLLFFVWLCVCV